MTAGLKPTGASSANATTWEQINWEQADADVKRLQMRIAKAMREGRHGKVKSLQWLLTHSFHAKALAVLRVTDNTGAKTPGTDGDIWVSPKQKMAGLLNIKRRGYQPLPLRRIYIPKKTGNKKRPLSIPTLTCRASQALHLLALEPVSETLADPNSYGFRPKRSCIDAIQQTKLNLGVANRSQFIFEGDIRSCFDEISHSWLLDNIPMDKDMLRRWLKAGYLEKSQLFPTNQGTPQGGIISPTLLVITLAGMEKAVKEATVRTDKVNVVVYADDFIITGVTKEVLEDKVKPVVKSFLKERGLELSEEKSRITHIDDGFDFLGFNIRKYSGRLLIKPSKTGINSFLERIREIIKANPTIKTENLISLLNPKIRGWSNYYRNFNSSKAFSKIDSEIFISILRWANRRHPNKGARWVAAKYFRTRGRRNWLFTARLPDKDNKPQWLDIALASKTRIRMHVKIKAAATPFDPDFDEYFVKLAEIRKAIKDEKAMPCF